MKTVVIYYSWSGTTERLAKNRAATEDAVLCAVKDLKRPGTLKAYTAGCLAARRMKRVPIVPLSISLEEYDRIVIMAPVWAGYPAPAINSVFDALPKGKELAVYLVSGSGSSICQAKVQALVEEKGCRLTHYENIKR